MTKKTDLDYWLEKVMRNEPVDDTNYWVKQIRQAQREIRAEQRKFKAIRKQEEELEKQAKKLREEEAQKHQDTLNYQKLKYRFESAASFDHLYGLNRQNSSIEFLFHAIMGHSWRDPLLHQHKSFSYLALFGNFDQNQ